MTIEEHAKACNAGSIPGGISIKIKEQAQAIVDACQWIVGANPEESGYYLTEDSEGHIRTNFLDGDEGWWGSDVVKWRKMQ